MGNHGKKGSRGSLLVSVTHFLTRFIACGLLYEKGVELIHHSFLFFCPFKYNAPLLFHFSSFLAQKIRFSREVYGLH